MSGVYGGLRIVASAHHPRVPDGHEARRLPAHPLVAALSRLLRKVGVRLDPWIEVKVPRFRDADPIYLPARGEIICSPAQADTLHARFGEPKPR